MAQRQPSNATSRRTAPRLSSTGPLSRRQWMARMLRSGAAGALLSSTAWSSAARSSEPAGPQGPAKGLAGPSADPAVGLAERPPLDRRLATRPLIIAHRGDSSRAPENTLPAFRLAIQAQADLVELDYYHSADQVPVVFHDRTLDRTTDARQRLGQQKVGVQTLAAKELLELDAGSWFGPDFAGTRIPTLEQALDVIQAGSTTLIERKAGDAATCIGVLRRRQLLRHVVVQAFDWKFLGECHRLAPELKLGALGGKELNEEKLDQIAATGARIVGWHHEPLTAAAAAAVRERGWQLWAYTVNDLPRARQLLQWGVQGLITDRPAILAQLRKS